MRAIVVGAGFAGLAAADELARAGADVEVLEARNRVGGRVWSAPFHGATIERGAEFALPDYEVMRSLCERAGLALVRKGTLYGYRVPRGGAPVSMAELEAGFATIAARAPHNGTLAEALEGLPLAPPVAEAIRARIEVSTTYPADDLDATVLEEGAGSFGRFDTHTVQGGNDRLAAALAATLARPPRLGAAAERVSWSEREVRVAGRGFELAGDALVLTVPASVIDRIAFDPALPRAKRDAVRAVRFGAAAKLFVGLRTPAPPSAVLSVPERYWCYTQLGPDGEPLPFLAAFAGTPAALHRLEVTRGAERWIESLTALRPDLDLDPRTVILSTWSDDAWARGSYSAPARSSPLDTAALAVPVGPIAFAGEHTAGAWHGLMEGALRSGIRAARELLEVPSSP